MQSWNRAFRLDDRVAIVTGAGRGLGQAIAAALAGVGARVVLVARSAPQLAESAAQIRAAGGKALPVPLDVTAEGSAAAAIGAALTQFGRCDILVMCAGAATSRPALEMSAADWDGVQDVNLRAAFFWSQAAGRRMAETRHGRIVHVASVTGLVGAAQIAPYCASKGGLIALTRSLAVEWAQMGITVNAIAPAYVRTALNEDALADERVLGHILRRTPMRRLGQPAEVAAAAVFLASDEASYITGHVLAVDGGWLAS